MAKTYIEFQPNWPKPTKFGTSNPRQNDQIWSFWPKNGQIWLKLTPPRLPGPGDLPPEIKNPPDPSQKGSQKDPKRSFFPNLGGVRITIYLTASLFCRRLAKSVSFLLARRAPSGGAAWAAKPASHQVRPTCSFWPKSPKTMIDFGPKPSKTTRAIAMAESSRKDQFTKMTFLKSTDHGHCTCSFLEVLIHSGQKWPKPPKNYTWPGHGFCPARGRKSALEPAKNPARTAHCFSASTYRFYAAALQLAIALEPTGP